MELIIGVIIVATMIWALWPRRGGLALLRRARLNTRRVLLEDALNYRRQDSPACGATSGHGHDHCE
jgi:hypothetical protein